MQSSSDNESSTFDTMDTDDSIPDKVNHDYKQLFGQKFVGECEWEFSNRLSTITNDKLINMIELPLQINIQIGKKNINTEIKTPDEFFCAVGFRRNRLLGKGGFGSVYAVHKYIPQQDTKTIIRNSSKMSLNSPSKFQVLKMACKEMRLDDKDRSLLNSLRAELYVLQGLRGKCPYVIEYYEHYVLSFYNVIERRHVLIANIFMELADGGSLLSEVIKIGPIPLKLAKRYFTEMVEGLAFMHRNQIAHNDFKLDNVLLLWDRSHRMKHCKLTDFGMARFAWKDGVGLLYSTRHCNSFEYVPFSADIWSLGVSLYLMLTREFPYEMPDAKNGEEKQYRKLLNDMQRGVIDTKNLKHRFNSNQLVRIMNGMLQYDSNNRYTIATIANDPWLKNKR
ncbi:hypothetical protein RDWZM_001282 [Blomia tropicalis]|uniref:non-specific serine/threonine protein kinase n=1 Tax=Blomia tropicalis TaxID=40697 RepID=A0A9Q0MEB8_BLOTA|nr:hypothetical protein RDWZM_001282 [Blomia tropicalis]